MEERDRHHRNFAFAFLIAALLAAACAPDGAEVAAPDGVEIATQAHLGHWVEDEPETGCNDPGLYDEQFTVAIGVPGDRTFRTTEATASYYEMAGSNDPLFGGNWTSLTEFRGADGAMLDWKGVSHAKRVDQLQLASPYWRARDVYSTTMGCIWTGACRNSAVQSHHNGLCKNRFVIKANIEPRAERKYLVDVGLEHELTDRVNCQTVDNAVAYAFVVLYARECNANECRTRSVGGGGGIGVWRSGRCEYSTTGQSAQYVPPIGWRAEWLKAVAWGGVGHVASAVKVRIRHLIDDGIIEL